METRANYIIVGIFTVVAILAAFAFVYWTAARYGHGGQTVMVRFRIHGSASGLGRGSAVLFNGVRVGDVKRVYIDTNRPSDAIADAEVGVETPVTKSTQADVGIASLTGQANIDLHGGNPGEPNILKQAAAAGVVAKMKANPSPVTNLLENGEELMERANTVLGGLQTFVSDNRKPLTRTIENAEVFSEALKDNSKGIDQLLANVGKLSGAIGRVSDKLDGTLEAAQGLIQSVDKKKVAMVVDNVATLTDRLNAASAKLPGIMAGVDTTVRSAAAITGKASGTVDRVDAAVDKVNGILAGVDPAVVKSALANIDQATGSAKAALQGVTKLTDTINKHTDDINGMIVSARDLAARLDAASGRLGPVIDNVDQTVASFHDVANGASGTLAKVNGAIDKVDGVIDSVDPKTVKAALANIEQASRTANQALQGVSKVADTINRHTGDIDQVIANARDLTGKLNAASSQLGKIMTNVDQTVTSVHGLSDNASTTLAKVNAAVDGVGKVVGSVDPQQVKTAVANIAEASGAAKGAIADIAKVSANIGQHAGDIDQVIANARDLTGKLDAASSRLGKIMTNVDQTVTSVHGLSDNASTTLAKVNAAVDGVGKVIGAVDPKSVKAAVANIVEASGAAKGAIADIAKVSANIGQHAGDVDQIIENAKELAQRLNGTSVRVDGLVKKLGAMLGSGDAQGLITQASATLKSFKQVADTLNAKLGPITEGLAKFSGSGLNDLDALLREGRRDINRIAEAIDELAQNPQRILTGGQGGVRQYDGRARH